MPLLVDSVWEATRIIALDRPVTPSVVPIIMASTEVLAEGASQSPLQMTPANLQHQDKEVEGAYPTPPLMAQVDR
jgi:hypothetical protein